ncbi:hypothetical protein EDB92DRAFT_1815071 [Lactarius akahatsu]|uniref:Uncharacterized protein n=1 Tax=Lactarius akahatsu TaxID=416441 RepID=A0AAD4LKT6_9AGAM|nr:hypothetical protein EDB92DRAFT_1815071 [Lactarius akahatsu]
MGSLYLDQTDTLSSSGGHWVLPISLGLNQPGVSGKGKDLDDVLGPIEERELLSTRICISSKDLEKPTYVVGGKKFSLQAQKRHGRANLAGICQTSNLDKRGSGSHVYFFFFLAKTNTVKILVKMIQEMVPLRGLLTSYDIWGGHHFLVREVGLRGIPKGMPVQVPVPNSAEAAVSVGPCGPFRKVVVAQGPKDCIIHNKQSTMRTLYCKFYPFDFGLIVHLFSKPSCTLCAGKLALFPLQTQLVFSRTRIYEASLKLSLHQTQMIERNRSGCNASPDGPSRAVVHLWSNEMTHVPFRGWTRVEITARLAGRELRRRALGSIRTI